jgi:hypothetical protein
VRKRDPHLFCFEAIATNNVEWDPLVLQVCVMLGAFECLDLPQSSPLPLNDMGWAGGAARLGCEGTSKVASRSAISMCRLNRACQMQRETRKVSRTGCRAAAACTGPSLPREKHCRSARALLPAGRTPRRRNTRPPPIIMTQTFVSIPCVAQGAR